jgi:Contractile injection system tube protein
MGCLSSLFPIKLGEAELLVIQPNSGRRLSVRFILRTYKLTKQNVFAEIAIPGLSGAPLEFTRGQPKLLSMVMYFDARNENRDVRELMTSVSDLMNVDNQIHAPPVLLFEWKGVSLTCVLESMAQEIISLLPDGRPSRAKMHVTFKEMRTQADLLQEENRE